MKSLAQLVPVEEHAHRLDQELLHNGFAVGWLGQDMPPFTSQKYAYLPFDVDSADRVNGTRTANTTRYSTDLRCYAAKIVPRHPGSGTIYNFTNEQGCTTYASLSSVNTYSMEYFSMLPTEIYRQNLKANEAPYEPRCPPSARSDHQFLAIWARGNNTKSNKDDVDTEVAAAFCEATYWKQDVRVSTLSKDSSVLEPPMSLSPRQELSDRDFNRTAFETLLGYGLPDPEYRKLKDYPFVATPNHAVRMKGTHVNDHGFAELQPSTMVGFAMAGDIRPADDYANLDIMQQTYERAHRYLFSLAIHSLLDNTNQDPGNVEKVEIGVEGQGIIVSRAIAAALEALLSIIGIFVLFILVLIWRMPSNLSENPKSMASMAKFVQANSRVSEKLQAVDNTDSDSLVREFESTTLKLVRSGDSSSQESHLIIVDDVGSVQTLSRNAPATRRESKYESRRPLALNRWFGGAVILVMIFVIGLLCYMKLEESKHIGNLSHLAAQKSGTDSIVAQVFVALRRTLRSHSYCTTTYPWYSRPFWSPSGYYWHGLYVYFSLSKTSGKCLLKRATPFGHDICLFLPKS